MRNRNHLNVHWTRPLDEASFISGSQFAFYYNEPDSECQAKSMCFNSCFLKISFKRLTLTGPYPEIHFRTAASTGSIPTLISMSGVSLMYPREDLNSRRRHSKCRALSGLSYEGLFQISFPLPTQYCMGTSPSAGLYLTCRPLGNSILIPSSNS